MGLWSTIIASTLPVAGAVGRDYLHTRMAEGATARLAGLKALLEGAETAPAEVHPQIKEALGKLGINWPMGPMTVATPAGAAGITPESLTVGPKVSAPYSKATELAQFFPPESKVVGERGIMPMSGIKTLAPSTTEERLLGLPAPSLEKMLTSQIRAGDVQPELQPFLKKYTTDPLLQEQRQAQINDLLSRGEHRKAMELLAQSGQEFKQFFMESLIQQRKSDQEQRFQMHLDRIKESAFRSKILQKSMNNRDLENVYAKQAQLAEAMRVAYASGGGSPLEVAINNYNTHVKTSQEAYPELAEDPTFTPVTPEVRPGGFFRAEKTIGYKTPEGAGGKTPKPKTKGPIAPTPPEGYKIVPGKMTPNGEYVIKGPDGYKAWSP